MAAGRTALVKRQRVILDLLRRAPQRPSETLLQYWLFLLREETGVASAIPFYDFFPHEEGPLSLTCCKEIDDLRARGLVDDRLAIADADAADSAAASLTAAVCDAVSAVLRNHGRESAGAMLAAISQNHPWYASRIASAEAGSRACAIYTTGYEGRSIDAFLDSLLRERIRRVVDVRKDAYSHKYGFTGGPLRMFCAKAGIDYQHVPELGVPSSLRADTGSDDKREELFGWYDRELLPTKHEARDRVVALLRERPGVLLCFEADPADCHRSRLATALASQSGLEVVHL